ncbi:nickel-dependent hydrogenase large subunit [Amphritea sp. HPY]|uniref:nickel-dependent hydrogenase large subunit n=1 Tax=Amphritea sp. HPY TaxID=3421652 RepID=UPI003D7C886C
MAKVTGHNVAGIKAPVMAGSIGPGQLSIEVDFCNNCIVDIDIVSQRPLHTYRLLQGKKTQHAIQLLPMLYSLCSTGQTVAGLRAVEQAGGYRVGVEVSRTRAVLLQAENCREILLRLGQNWLPRSDANNHLMQHFMIWYAGLQNLFAAALCLKPSTSEVIAATRELPLQANLLERLLAEFFGFKPTELATRLSQLCLQDVTSNPVLQSVVAQQQRFGGFTFCADLPSLPDLSCSDAMARLEQLLTAADSRDYCVAPHWQQQCCETGCYQRMQHEPAIRQMRQRGWGEIAIRYSCMLLELAQMPDRLRMSAKECFVHSGTDKLQLHNIGYGIAETARGTLLHRVVMEQGKVAEYHIVAPTEWNFHRQGVLAKKLKGLAVESEQHALELTGLFALLVDPCVGYQVSLKSELLHA